MFYYEQLKNEANVISDSLKQFYFKDENITADNIQILGQIYFKRSVWNCFVAF